MILLSAKQALLNHKINGRYPILHSNGKYYIKYLKINKYNKPYWTKFGTWDTLTHEQKHEASRREKFICDVLNIYYERLKQYKNELKESINITTINRNKYIIQRTSSLTDEFQPDYGVLDKLWKKFLQICSPNCTYAEQLYIKRKIDLMQEYERILFDAFYLDLITSQQLSESIEAIVITDKDGFTYIQAGPGYTTPNLDKKFIELAILPCSVELK